MTDRTAISYLTQICARRNITPQYDLEATGPAHQPTFVFKCTAGLYTFTGNGKSKKKAKNQAAFGVLQQILAAEPSPDHPEIILHSLSVDEDDLEMQNPVAMLQEMAQGNKLQPPKYEYKPGPDTKDFVCVVTMAEMEAQGVGISKKAAKKLAAKNLICIAENSPYSMPENVKVASEEQEGTSTESECINLEEEDPWILGEDDSAPHVVGLQLKNPEGAAVGKLRSADLDVLCDVDYVEQLRSLAAEQDWTIQYHEIPSPSPEQHLMLVEVSKIKLADIKSKSHTAVHHGMEHSLETCKNNTARNMLKYLKTMSFNED